MPQLIYQFQSRTDTVDFYGMSLTAGKARSLIAKKIGTADTIRLFVGDREVSERDTLTPGTTVTVTRMASTGFHRRVPGSGPITPGQGEVIGVVASSSTSNTKDVTYNDGGMMPTASSAVQPTGTTSTEVESHRLEGLMQDTAHSIGQVHDAGMLGGGGAQRPQRALPKAAPTGKPPDTYKCDLCGRGGHWIQHCPYRRNPGERAEKRLLPPVGISAANLEIVDNPENCSDAKFRTAGGKVARRKVDTGAFKGVVQGGVNLGEVPPRVRCGMCVGLVRDAVRLSCCPDFVVCAECLERRLDDSDQRCPNCSKVVPLIDGYGADEATRRKVTEFLCSASSRVEGDETAALEKQEQDQKVLEEECW
eukprot:PhM_4_TR217/c0_g1_i1/m.58775/K15541/MPE1; protein MPE1